MLSSIFGAFAGSDQESIVEDLIAQIGYDNRDHNPNDQKHQKAAMARKFIKAPQNPFFSFAVVSFMTTSHLKVHDN